MVDNISGASSGRSAYTPISQEKPPVKQESKKNEPPPLSDAELSELNIMMKKAVVKLGSTEPQLTNILAIIMANLTKMTQSLQNFAMTQAKELEYLTKMQDLYTSLISKIPIYDTQKNLPYGVSKDDEKVLDKVGNANQRMSAITEGLRNLRDMLAEDAKRKQTEINTSDDAQKGMLDFMQNFMQKQREWLQSIFR